MVFFLFQNQAVGLISAAADTGSSPVPATKRKTPLEKAWCFFYFKIKLSGSYPPPRTQVRVFVVANY
jgi:hypothetical protein